MTHATKAIYRLLLSDYVKVSKVSVEDMLYDGQDILRSMDKIEVSHYLPLLASACPLSNAYVSRILNGQKSFKWY